MEPTSAIGLFMALFAVANPIAAVPIFLGLTEGMTAMAQRRVALATLLAVSVGALVVAAVGGGLLHVFGVSVDHFRLAGGLLVLLIALAMLNGEDPPSHHGSERERSIAPATTVAFYPLAVPLILGPGAISALIVHAHTAAASGQYLSFVLGLVSFLGALGVTLFAAPAIGHHVSPSVLAIVRRLMGIILAAIAVQMVTASVASLFPALVR